MFRTLAVSLCCVLALVSTVAANKEQSRLEDSGLVPEEILAAPDNIPRDLLAKSECVIVIPSMLKVARGIGGTYGRGVMVCRTGPGFTGLAVPAAGQRLVNALELNAPRDGSQPSSN